MSNFRPFSDTHNSKSTNKQPIGLIMHITNPLCTSMPIKRININDKDRFGNTVYTGSAGGKGYKPKKSYTYNIESLKPLKRKNIEYTGGFFRTRKKKITYTFSIRRKTRVFNKPQLVGKVIDGYRIISQV